METGSRHGLCVTWGPIHTGWKHANPFDVACVQYEHRFHFLAFAPVRPMWMGMDPPRPHPQIVFQSSDALQDRNCTNVTGTCPASAFAGKGEVRIHTHHHLKLFIFVQILNVATKAMDKCLQVDPALSEHGHIEIMVHSKSSGNYQLCFSFFKMTHGIPNSTMEGFSFGIVCSDEAGPTCINLQIGSNLGFTFLLLEQLSLHFCLPSQSFKRQLEIAISNCMPNTNQADFFNGWRRFCVCQWKFLPSSQTNSEGKHSQKLPLMCFDPEGVGGWFCPKNCRN